MITMNFKLLLANFYAHQVVRRFPWILRFDFAHNLMAKACVVKYFGGKHRG